MDVTPRTSAPDDLEPSGRVRPPRSRSRGFVIGVVLVAVLGAVGFLLVKQVGSASLYYYNADQAVAKKAELGDRHFRIQGTYVGTKQEQADGTVRFTIAFNGAKVLIDHSGSEPALFKPGIPVVLEGKWSSDGTEFLSDRIEVKHTETYVAAHPDRVESDQP